MPITVKTLQKLKDENKKFATITAYDASFARIFDDAGIAAILVGDSLGNTIQGGSSTLSVTVKDMVYHTKCVRAGIQNALLITDLPFMSYTNVKDACKAAHKIMAAGANMIKIEGGKNLAPIVEVLVQNGVPVCAHLGLTPQSVNVFGGYRIQGREDNKAKQLIDDALALEAAGASLVVLECIPKDLAKQITETVKIPVIGIGAGNSTDGQILVMHDALGLTIGKSPSFAKNFLSITGNIPDAIKLYIKEVEDGLYPDDEHSFN